MGAKKKSPSTEIVDEQRARVVEKIIGDMEKNGLRWSEPYLPSLSPHNPVSGTVYKGGNRLHLGFVGFMRGFEDNRWCTFNQIRDSGWHLKKGSKAAIIEKWREFSVKEENKETGEQEVTGRYLRLVGYWNVFNAQEIEGIPKAPAPEHEQDYTAGIADNLILSSRCPVRESPRYPHMAAYTPTGDYIMIAPRGTFRSDESFTRVLLHEMAHSTGHGSALGRDCSTKFGSPEYAEEELVAELGSLFLSSDLGIQSADLEGAFYENHVSYLKSWMHALKDDPAYLFKAAAKADKAGNYIMERYEQQREKERETPQRAETRISLLGEAALARLASDALADKTPARETTEHDRQLIS